MKTKFKITLTILMFTLFSLSLFFGGCGGGGGTRSSYTNGSGSVALYIKDAPADDYENIWISIEAISLIPFDGSQPPIVIFSSNDPNGYSIDLLDLRDQDMLFTFKGDVPAGLYSKIRLEVKNIIPVPKLGAPCTDMQIKLPSGKIDLNPQGGVYIQSGQTVAIRLDIDVNKSIQIHPAGKSGKCIFRPVVFVDIKTVQTPPQNCLQLLEGIVGDVLYDEGSVVGFILELPDDRGPLDIFITNAAIFDENGLPIQPADLAGKAGLPVSVRGELDDEARFQAYLVVVGQTMALKGLVEGPVDSNDQFPLNIEPGQQIGGKVTVALSNESIILMGCGQLVDKSYIQKDMLARVIGRYDTNTALFHAVAVFLQPIQVVGELESIQTINGVDMLTIKTVSGSSVDVVMPKDVPPMLEGDGVIPVNLFNCAIGKDIRIMLDPEIPLTMTAVEVRVQPEVLSVTVDEVYAWGWYGSTVKATDDQGNILVISVQPTATILKFTNNPQASSPFTPIPLDGVAKGDRLTIFALPVCDNVAVNYSAFVLLVYP